ncbi:hypothetical protein [Cupriavidus pauculus]
MLAALARDSAYLPHAAGIGCGISSVDDAQKKTGAGIPRRFWQ